MFYSSVNELRGQSDESLTLLKRLLPDLMALSKLGASGQYSNNINRDYLRLLGAPKIPVTRCNIPLKVPGQIMPQQTLQKLVLPHRLFSKLFEVGGSVWENRVCPSPERLQSFWDRMDAVEHPNMAYVSDLLRDRPRWRERAVPIKIYGDGVPCTGVGKSWAKSMATYTCSSMVARGRTLDITFLIWAVMEGLIAKNLRPDLDTKKSFWKKLVHSLNACYHGEYLPYDEDGHEYDPDSGWTTGREKAVWRHRYFFRGLADFR